MRANITSELQLELLPTLSESSYEHMSYDYAERKRREVGEETRCLRMKNVEIQK